MTIGTELPTPAEYRERRHRMAMAFHQALAWGRVFAFACSQRGVEVTLECDHNSRRARYAFPSPHNWFFLRGNSWEYTFANSPEIDVLLLNVFGTPGAAELVIYMKSPEARTLYELEMLAGMGDNHE